MQWHVFVTEDGQGEKGFRSLEQVEKNRKVKHRELNPRNLSLEKQKELDKAEVKEWNKIVNSGAMKVHVGEKRLERLKERLVRRGFLNLGLCTPLMTEPTKVF